MARVCAFASGRGAKVTDFPHSLLSTARPQRVRRPLVDAEGGRNKSSASGAGPGRGRLRRTCRYSAWVPAKGMNGRGRAMKRNAFNFREHFDRQLSNLAELKKRNPHQANTNVVDINDRLPLHLDMVVSDCLAHAVDASRKAGASDHRIFRRMAEIAASVLDDPMRPQPSPEGPEEALRF